MIVRILLAVSLVLLLAAPAPVLAGSLHLDPVEEVSPAADDEAPPPAVIVQAAAPPRAARPNSSEDVVPPRPSSDRIFRPPRSVRSLASNS